VRVAIKILLTVVITIAACIMLAAIIIDRSKFEGREKVAEAVQPKVPVVEDGGSWPMFRGGQRLLGRASGVLPDSPDLVWKFKTEGEIKSSPVISDGLVFVGSADANTYAIDLARGHKVWEYPTGGTVEAAPCVVEGMVFVGSSDTFLYAIDAKSGASKWRYKTDGKILGAANWTRSPDGQRTWHCVDAASGDVVWTYETDSYVNGSPAIGEGNAVFGGCDAMIHVVSLADGSKVREIDSGSYIAASAAVSEGHVYVGNYDSVFVKADIATSEIVWKYTGGDSPYFSSPAIGEEAVVFGGRDNRVHCVRRSDRNVAWTFKTLGEVDSSPVICGDKVVVGSEDGRLYMIRLSDGKEIWSYEAPKGKAGVQVYENCSDYAGDGRQLLLRQLSARRSFG
jgi:outer membrane protein assembly factor BamB